MNSELKYILKGCLFTGMLLIISYAICYLVTYKSQKPGNEPQSEFNIKDLMNDSNVVAGKLMFENHCSACHSLHKKDSNFLNEMYNNSSDERSLYGWIRNSDSVLLSGNIYYNNLFKEYNKIRMASFPELTDDDIDKILIYIKAEIILEKWPAP